MVSSLVLLVDDVLIVESTDEVDALDTLVEDEEDPSDVSSSVI